MTVRDVSIGLSLQRALLGAVPAHLRGVSVAVDGESLHLCFYFDGAVSEHDAESVSDVEAEVLADLPPSVRVRTALERIDTPAPLPPATWWVYLRREPTE